MIEIFIVWIFCVIVIVGFIMFCIKALNKLEERVSGTESQIDSIRAKVFSIILKNNINEEIILETPKKIKELEKYLDIKLVSEPEKYIKNK